MRDRKFSRKGLSLFLVAGVATSYLLFASKDSKQEELRSQRAVLGSSPLSGIRSRLGLGGSSRRALAQAQAEVSRRNSEAHRDRERFLADGWVLVETAAPDVRITGLDPSALVDREREVQVQLQTNTYSGEMLDRVYALYKAARAEETRYVALESLGRSHDRKAKTLLMRAFDDASSSRGEREQALGLLRPETDSDATASFLVRVVERRDTSDELKIRAISQLVGLSLARGSLSPRLVDRLPEQWRKTMVDLYSRARLGGNAG